MALTILIRTQLNSIPVLSDDCYTKENYAVGYVNDTLSVNTPRGVLGGSVAGISATADYTAVPCTDHLRPIGIFVNDAAGAAFENSPAVASGKLAIIKGMASVEVDVYETDGLTGGSVPGQWTVADLCYCSAHGFLTNVASNEGTVIGVCTKAPTTASPTLGLDERI
jgi:hypothetical protein